MEFNEEFVLPFETEYFTDLFECGLTKESVSPSPVLQMGNALIEISWACIIGLDAVKISEDAYVGGGRRYLFVKAKPNLVGFLATRLRVYEPGSVHFRVKIRQGRALIVAIQGNDPGPAHWLAIVKSESIPEDADLA